MLSRTASLMLALTLVALPVAPAAADEPPTEAVTTPVEPIPEPTPTPEPSDPPAESTDPIESTPAPPATSPLSTSAVAAADEAEETAAEIEDGQLRWGINNESNNAAFAPGTANFFSAGKIPNPGRGGTVVPQSSWSASQGNVSIEKWNGSAYVPATWAGLKTDSSGAAITSPTSGRFSNHTVVLDHGTGTVDPANDAATITWDADFTVLYYSGMTFFYVSDPVLTVKDGVGTVTATLSGFASSMEDLTKWEAVAPREVTIATLGTVDLTQLKGFTSTPKYSGVRVTGVDQVNGAHAGSFPQSFIDFQKVAGAAPYWYSSGGATDAYKPALPMTISYDASDAVIPKPPATGGGGQEVTNDIVNPPNMNLPGNLVFASNVALPLSPPVPEATAALEFQQVAQPTMHRAMSATPDSPVPAAVWWWLGSTLMILAASSVAGTLAYSAASTRR